MEKTSSGITNGGINRTESVPWFSQLSRFAYSSAKHSPAVAIGTIHIYWNLNQNIFAGSPTATSPRAFAKSHGTASHHSMDSANAPGTVRQRHAQPPSVINIPAETSGSHIYGVYSN